MSELGSIRTKFEGWLEENCQKNGKNLKAMLKKIESAALAGRRV
jgi:checkpoint serine/threonine-protein kinase